MKRIITAAALVAAIFTSVFVSCGKTSSSPESTETKESQSESQPQSESQSGGISDDEFVPRAKGGIGSAEIVDKDYDYGDPSGWAGDDFSSVSLGYVNLQDVVEDYVYDWGHSIIKEGDTYKMWWVRPAVYDAIFYAESKDLKNWYNLERVICLSPNSANVKKYDNMKGMLGKPSVVKVNGTYYMYFEAPATEDPDITQTVLEWDNQVMLATSPDGKQWNFHVDEKGQPTPVIAMPKELMGNFNTKEYGAGQPSVFYKDGLFYLTYCYVVYSQNIAEIRVATSADGVNFGDVSAHTAISPGNGKGVTYDEKTGKYMMVDGSTVSVSDALDFSSAEKYVYYSYDGNNIQTGFAEFVRNEHGIVDTETFYVIHLQGDKSMTSDWRAGYRSWDGFIHAVNPTEYANRTIVLPNGGAATENNLKGYRDTSAKYARPTADAVYVADADVKIDGEMDDFYRKGTKIEVSRAVYEYGSDFTDTWAEAYFGWNEDFLYCFAKVYDRTYDVSYALLDRSLCYMHDSLDVFIDVPNDHGTAKEVAYGLDQYMICTDANNTDFVIKGSDEYDLTSEFSSVRRRVRKTGFGYTVEWRVPWYDFVQDSIRENMCIGIDVSVNDARNSGVGREAMVVWSDHTGNAFRYVDGFGDVYLVKR